MTFRGVTNEELTGKDNSLEYHKKCLELIKDTQLKWRNPPSGIFRADQKTYDWQGPHNQFEEWVSTPEGASILSSICRCDSSIFTSDGFEYGLYFDMHDGPQLTRLPFVIK